MGSLSSAARLQKQVDVLAASLPNLMSIFEDDVGTYGATVIGISLKCTGGDVLAVLRGLSDSGVPVVAFYAASTLLELFLGLEGALRAHSLRWKADKPWSTRTAPAGGGGVEI